MKFITKITCVLLTLVMLVCSAALCACGDEPGQNDGGKTDSQDGVTRLSFKNASSYETLQSLDGKTVTINGYMASSSPVSGAYIFLMNLPYQSCPFCVPNTSQLSNTMEVYPQKGETFTYTTQAIRVTGTLEVAADGEWFTDDYGYEFAFKLVNADYVILKDEDLAIDTALWNKIADSDLVSELYNMLDYLHFVSHWTEYYVNNYTDPTTGTTTPGYYLWPADVDHYLRTENAQWNYGYQDGYFEALVTKINKLDAAQLADLVTVVTQAQDFAARSIAELDAGNYTYASQYIEMFGTTDYVYTLANAASLDAEYQSILTAFTTWLGSWEL